MTAVQQNWSGQRVKTCSDDGRVETGDWSLNDQSATDREQLAEDQATDLIQGPVSQAIWSRRSIRRFLQDPVDEQTLTRVIAAALVAPAPHHSRPWRFAAMRSSGAKSKLATAMASAWSEELERQGFDSSRIAEMTAKSIARVEQSPALILACIDSDEIPCRDKDWESRAEWTMACFSLGAALENLMLAAEELALGSCWIAAPLYCPEVVRKSLGLPHAWAPQALILLGRPDPNYRPPSRSSIDTQDFVVFV